MICPCKLEKDLRREVVVDEIKVFEHEEEIPLSQRRVAEQNVFRRVAEKRENLISFLGKAESEGRPPVVGE